MPAALRASASATSCSGVALPTSHIGATAGRTAPPMRSITDTPAERASEIEERHLDRRVRAGVAVEDGAHALEERGPHPRVGADQHGGEMVAHGGNEAGDGVAGHGRRRRRLTPADGSVLRLDAHQEVAGVGHRLGRHLDRLGQRQRQRDRIDPADRERRAGEFGSRFGGDLHGWALGCARQAIYSTGPPLVMCAARPLPRVRRGLRVTPRAAGARASRSRRRARSRWWFRD